MFFWLTTSVSQTTMLYSACQVVQNFSWMIIHLREPPQKSFSGGLILTCKPSFNSIPFWVIYGDITGSRSSASGLYGLGSRRNFLRRPRPTASCQQTDGSYAAIVGERVSPCKKAWTSDYDIDMLWYDTDMNVFCFLMFFGYLHTHTSSTYVWLLADRWFLLNIFLMFMSVMYFGPDRRFEYPNCGKCFEPIVFQEFEAGLMLPFTLMEVLALIYLALIYSLGKEYVIDRGFSGMVWSEMDFSDNSYNQWDTTLWATKSAVGECWRATHLERQQHLRVWDMMFWDAAAQVASVV